MRALAVHRGAIVLVQRLRWVERVSMVGRESVGKKDGFMKGIRRGRIDSVGRKNNQDEDERVDPSMFEGDLFPLPQKGACFPSLRMWPERFFACLGSRER